MLDGMCKAKVLQTGNTSIEVRNPVFDGEFPDPCVIQHEDKLIAYATSRVGYENIQMIECGISDLNNWTLKAEGALYEFPNQWLDRTKGILAPYVVAVDNEFRIYYSGTFKDGSGMGSGVSKSKSPYAFEGDLEPIQAGPGYRYIDSHFFRDHRTSCDYYYVGSQFDSIIGFELNSEGTARAVGAKIKEVVSPHKGCHIKGQCKQKNLCKWKSLCKHHRQYEAVYVRWSEELQKYILYVSSGGWETFYSVIAFKSDHPLGPFEPLNNGFPVLRNGRTFSRPGQNMNFQLNGVEFAVYHAIPKNDRFTGNKHLNRVMCIDPVIYENGIPFIGNGTPSSTFTITL